MLKFVEGFELVTTTAGMALKGYSYVDGYGTKSIVTGRNSGQALQCTSIITESGGKAPQPIGNFPWVVFPIGASISSGVAGFAFNSNTAAETNYRVFFGLIDTNGSALFWLARAGNNIYLFQPINAASATITTNPYFSFAKDVVTSASTGTPIGWNALAVSSGFTVAEATWYYLEVKFALGVGGGVVINCNQQQIMNYNAGSGSFLPTWETYSGLANRFVLGYSILTPGGSIGTSSAQYNTFDDVYVCDLTGTQNNGFMGNVYISKMVPNSTVSAGFAPNGASQNWQCVNDADPNGLTNYVSTSTTGTIDVYGTTTTSQTGSVLGVSLNVCGEQVSGTGAIAPLVQVSGTNYFGSAVSMGAGAFATTKQIMELNPATGSPWTQASVNATNFGIRYTTP